MSKPFKDLALIRSKRHVVEYSRDLEQIHRDVEVHVDIDFLMQILVPRHYDHEFVEGYMLTKGQLEKLLKFAIEPLVPDWEKYYYVLEATGYYE